MADLVVHVNEGNFQTEVMESSVPVLVDFWADWCGPCLALAPILEEIARETEGRVKVCKVDVQENPALAAKFNIRNIPFLAFIKDGQKVSELVGNQPKQMILKHLETYK